MTRWLLLLPLTLGSAAATATADDIWQRRDPRYSFLFQDNRARRVGDIVTIVINETTNTNEREQRALDKSNDSSGNAAFSGTTSNGTGGRTGSLTFSLTDAFRKRFSGSSQLSSNRVFQDRISATVVDIMPNGNLVIEAYSRRVVATEERVLRVTGVIRQADVGLGNLVQSSSIANLKVSYLGRGPATRTLNQNYFGRFMNRAWPW
ncbi:flagellar basal body L-ring protein FlgH [Limnoglobus roseus]|uniref:Flagellar basal body L-ring protein FlgH n=1 Tax=Limnoglobus roseus TaxID=2598579 RepID=A0A5C1A630_9BACT|nr:flagellar basal body L-ring protein FlgH [Limnoglobus roseus]QEL13793.1 flagellar basal body L-ring protein FlgH [Limnoglobus roseus]